jgi:thiol-disulfide isomerase/thioredoxin
MVLNLWATWCAPCRRELPAFDRVSEQYHGEVAIVGINQGDDVEGAQAMLDEIGVDFPQAVDSSSELSRELAITSMPSTVFVSASGEIVDTHAGELNADQLTALLEEHFEITPAPA